MVHTLRPLVYLGLRSNMDRLAYGVFFVLFSLLHFSTGDDIAKELEDVLSRESNVAALFTKKCCTCTDCVEAEALLAAVQADLQSDFKVVVVKLIEQSALEKQYGVKEFPSLVYLRNRQPALYNGPFEKEALFEWFSQSQEVTVKKLDDSSFEHLTQAATGATTGDWLVAFLDSTCGGLPLDTVLAGLAIKVKGRVLVAEVDTGVSSDLKERFHIDKCPTLLFFRQGKMYLYDLPSTTIPSLKSFVEGFYRNSKATPVPVPKSPFDKLVEVVTEKIKENPMLGLMVVGGLLLFLTTLYGISEKKDPQRKKDQ